MQRQNTIIIGLVSALIIISMSVSVNSEFRHKIRQFIGDDTSKYYLQTINISKRDSTEIEILTHTIVKLNNDFIGHRLGLLPLDIAATACKAKFSCVSKSCVGWDAYKNAFTLPAVVAVILSQIVVYPV